MRIRPGNTADIEAISQGYAESWRTTYTGLAPDVFVKGMTASAAAKIFHESLRSNQYAYFLHVAETENGRIVGFSDGGKERSHPEKGIGELYAVYLLKDFQRQGIGRELWQAGVQSLRQSGMNSMLVWVLEKNVNHPFYLSLGGVLQTGIKTLKVAQYEIRLVCYFWENLK